MSVVIVWLIMALIGCAIGQINGRPAAGFLWGLLLGPIGWLIVIIGPNMKPKCPECGGIVVEGARKCKNCGSALPTITTATEESPLPKSEDGTKVCPVCKQVLPIPARMCICGHTWPPSQCH